MKSVTCEGRWEAPAVEVTPRGTPEGPPRTEGYDWPLRARQAAPVRTRHHACEITITLPIESPIDMANGLKERYLQAI